MMRLLLRGLGALLAVSISANALAGPSAFMDPNDDSGTRVKIGIPNLFDSPFCGSTVIRPWKLVDGTYTASTPIKTVNPGQELFITIVAGGNYFFKVTYCTGLIPEGDAFDAIMVTEDTNTLDVPGLALPVPPTPPAPFISQNPAVSSIYSVNWIGSGANTYYRISERVQTLDDWEVGTGENWGDWSEFQTTAPVSVPANSTATQQAYEDQDPGVYQYRVIACNLDDACSGVSLSEAVVVQTPQLDQGQTFQMQDAKVRAIWTSPEGCYVLFEDLPAACETSFNNAHALIPFENPNHEKMYSQVFLANALGQSIDVWFDDNGDCGSLAGLMRIGRIETEDIRQSAGGQN